MCNGLNTVINRNTINMKLLASMAISMSVIMQYSEKLSAIRKLACEEALGLSANAEEAVMAKAGCGAGSLAAWQRSCGATAL